MMKPDRVFADGRGACDACRPASRVFPFQAADANYLCAGCDDVTRIHAPTAQQHEPAVRAFERAPTAVFQCRDDAASTMCSPSDANFSTLNTLARRHQSNASASVDSRDDLGFLGVDMDEEADEEEAAAWMLLDPAAVCNSRQCNDSGLLYGAEVEDYLNLGGYASYSENQFNLNDHYESKQQTNGLISQQTSSCCGDGVIPVQTQPRPRFESPIAHTNVSLSSVDAGVATESEGSEGGAVAGQWRPAKGTMDLLSPGVQNPATEAAAAVSLSGVEREARVLRYREKKKARRFEKTIRYASRKAYAESRPRIKGRFAKRASHADQIEQTFSPPAMADHSGYDWFISPGRD